MNLIDKTALVTGASRGIGRAIAVALANAGASVAITYTSDEDGANETLNAVENAGAQGCILRCDSSDATAVQAAVAEVLEKWGRIDILVNNAGITKDNLMLRMSAEDFDRVYEVNVRGAFLMTKACLRPMMKQKYGKIINISSVVGIFGNAGQANYAASKAAMIGLTKSTAKELGSRGIRANAIAPGFIETKMTDSLPEEVKESMLADTALGAFGKPEDVAALCVFLASGASDYITGEVIRVDGGMA